MKRLKLLILVFFLTLTLPLGYLIHRTYRGLEQEELSQLRYFAETMFDEMEDELAAFVAREEARAVDEFNFFYQPEGHTGPGGRVRSPLSRPPAENFIVGYIQNNPDGSFQSPLFQDAARPPGDLAGLAERLAGFNKKFNARRHDRPGRRDEPSPPARIQAQTPPEENEAADAFVQRFLSQSKTRKPRTRLGSEKTKVRQITVDQLNNMAALEQAEKKGDWRKDENDLASAAPAEAGDEDREDEPEGAGRDEEAGLEEADKKPAAEVEIDPLQSVSLDSDHVFLFRRIVLEQKVYRQGVVVDAAAFLNHLKTVHFSDQPMAGFTWLTLRSEGPGRESLVRGGRNVSNPVLTLSRLFPRPFDFLSAELRCDRPPRSGSRRAMTLVLVFLSLVVILGLLAIYNSARVVQEMSERRQGFVSSVTHELKTPLTNIRMYVEMLEQGVAPDPEREQEYFRILGSESARLSRLIDNVLEFSRIETRQRSFDLKPGNFQDLAAEVESLMGAKLRREGFRLELDLDEPPPVRYDREAMIQILLNLLENSVKFGRSSAEKLIEIRVRSERDRVELSVSDRGPGIAPKALSRVFDDFYREDNSLTRNTKGTGIGLALVRKLVRAMGGRVRAENNDGPGCTITVSLPVVKG